MRDAARALEVATTVGQPAEQVAALVETGIAQTQLGDSAAGIASIAAAARTAERNGMTGEAFLRQGHLAWYLMMSGDVEGGLSLASRGRSDALAAGLPVVAAFCGEQELEVLQWQGRWADTDEMLAEMLAIGMPEYRWRMLRAWSLIARGDIDGARALHEEMAAEAGRATDDIFEDDAQRLVRQHLLSGDVSDALQVADRYAQRHRRQRQPLGSGSGGQARLPVADVGGAGRAHTSGRDGGTGRGSAGTGVRGRHR